MRTSLTFLTLLAAASSAVAAPLPAHDGGSGAVQKVVSGHRRSDSRVVVDMQEHLTDKSNKSHMNSDKMSHEHKSSKNAVKSGSNRVKEAVQKIENRRSRSSVKRAIVSLFPDQNPGSKAGVVDAHTKDADAHLIQTPGKDRTIVDVKAGDVDAKVNLPKVTPAPVKEATKQPKPHGSGKPAGQVQHEGDDLFKGVGVSLNGKKGPLDGVINDGKGGPQGIEISIGDNRPKNSPSPSPSASKAPASSPKPTSSAAPRSSSASAPKSSAASGKPSSKPSPKPSSSASKAAPKPSASSKAPAPSSSSCPPCAAPSHGPSTPAKSSSDSLVNVDLDEVKLDIGKPNILTGKKPVSTGNMKDMSKPAKIDFGNMPKHTVPCDGIMVRDNGDIVDICREAHLLEKKPKNYHACPEFTQHELHAHYVDKHADDELSRQIQDYVRLCVGAGAL